MAWINTVWFTWFQNPFIFPVVISNFKVKVNFLQGRSLILNTPFSDKKINSKTEISNMFYLCIYNLKHALKDSRFIVLKLCCLNVRSLHKYSNSEIAIFDTSMNAFPSLAMTDIAN